MIERRPQVVLVDELAHTNTPGSRNPKRWQDVEELLDAGITVISTVNVQHLESLNDVVTQITGIEQQEKVPDEVVRAADQIELVDITPEALRRRLSHGNVYAPERVDAALSNYFRPGNLTALRELALLWLADQVDAALAKYREDNQITDTWEARERVVVAVTGGPESETLVRRAFRIASKSSAELMVRARRAGRRAVGRVRTPDGQGARAGHQPRRDLHTVVGDDVPTALLDFAREMNATQLVIGTSRRSRWARIFDEGIGAAVVQQSGKIDVHMVTHGEAKAGSSWSSLTPAQRHLDVLAGRGRGAVGYLRDHRAACSTRFLGVGGESALFFVGVLVVALLGGVAPAALSALLSGLLLNYFLVEPALHVHHRRTRQRRHHRRAAGRRGRGGRPRRRRGQARAGRPRRRRRKPNCSRCSPVPFCGAPTWTTLLERVRETYSQRAVSMLRVVDDDEGRSSRASATTRASTVDTADTAIEVGDDEFWMLMAGTQLAARDRRVLDRGRQTGRGPGQAARAHRGGEQGRGDRACRRAAALAAVGGQPRPAHAAGRRQGGGVEPAQRRRRLLRRGHRRAAGHRRGVHRSAHRAGRQSARLVTAGGRGGTPRAAPGLPRGDGATRAASESASGSTGFRSVLDRVKVDVGRHGRDGRQRSAGAGARQPDRQRAALRARTARCGSPRARSATGC